MALFGSTGLLLHVLFLFSLKYSRTNHVSRKYEIPFLRNFGFCLQRHFFASLEIPKMLFNEEIFVGDFFFKKTSGKYGYISSPNLEVGL